MCLLPICPREPALLPVLLPSNVIEGHLRHLHVHLHVVVSSVCDGLLIRSWSVGRVLCNKTMSSYHNVFYMAGPYLW